MAQIMVDFEEYLALKKDRDWLHCLEAAGVDNWEGYSHAREIGKEDGVIEDEED